MRGRCGKSDAMDAEAAAHGVIRRDRGHAESGDEPLEAIRVLKLAKDSAVTARGAGNQPTQGCPVNAEPQLREELAAESLSRLVARSAHLDSGIPRQIGVSPPLSRTRSAGWLVVSSTSLRRSTTPGSASPRPSGPPRPHCRSCAVSARIPQRSCSSPLATTRTDCEASPRSRRCAVSARSRPPLARPSAIASTEAGIGGPTQRCSEPYSPACDGTSAPANTCNGEPSKYGPNARSFAACLERFQARAVYQIIRDALATPV